MKLFYSPASPFVRKVLVVAHERGLVSQIELVTVATSPVATDAKIPAHNPLGKIPALVLDDGTALYDSRVIVEHLDAIGTVGPRLIPERDRLRVLVRQALGDGLCDAAALLRYETWLRPEEKRWPEWIAGQWSKVGRALDECEADVPRTLDVGAIAIACGLGYLDLRFADSPWRATRPQLAAWFDELAERPSMIATKAPA